MPYKFTEAEKEALRQKYRENIETINHYIEQGLNRMYPNGGGPANADAYKFKLDMPGLEKKLNDPEKAWFYKNGLDYIAENNKKKDIQERLEAKYAHLRIPGKQYPLGRFLHTELIPSDDPAAEAYNDAYIKNYTLHPEAVVQKRFQRLLNSNVSQLADIAKCKDKRNLMAYWGRKNPGLAFEAFELFGTISKYPKDMLTPEMEKYLDTIGRNYELLMDTTEPMIHVSEGFFTLPQSLTDAQENIINGSSIDIDHPDIGRGLIGNGMAAKSGLLNTNAKFTNFFKGINDNGIDVSGDGALTEYIVENVGGKHPEVSLGAWFNGSKLDGQPRLKHLTQQEVAGIKKVFKVDYTKEEGFKEPDFPKQFKGDPGERARSELVFKYAIAQDKPIHELDNGGFGKIAEAIKGGIGERLFGHSAQYGNLIQAMKAYDNENHVYYKDSKPVKMAANDYLIHKGVKTREEALRLSSPAKDRAILCFDIIETFQKAEPATMDKIIPGTREIAKGPHKEWPPAIEDPKVVEVNDFGPEDIKEEKAVSKNIDNDLEKDDNLIENENLIQ